VPHPARRWPVLEALDMEKKFRITVGGRIYKVTVEEPE
jgi:hypothetical protein